MRSGPNTRRPMRRGGGGNNNNNGNSGRRGGSPRTQNFESNGPDIKVRGNAQQIVDKYQTLAREAATAGNPVMAENYYQHAEHYHRVLTASGGGENRQNNRQPEGDDGRNSHGAESNQQQSSGQSNGQADSQTNVQAAGQSTGQSNGQASGQPTESATNGGFENSPEVAPAPENSAPPEVTATPEVVAFPEVVASSEVVASTEDAGDEIVRKTRRKRAPRAAKPVEATDEPAAAVPSETAPAPTIAQPEAEDGETVIKTAS